MLMLLDEVLFSLNSQIPCREVHFRQLTTLLSSSNGSTLIVHGAKATGKSLAVQAVLDAIDTPSAIVRSRECITTRHLLERMISAIQYELKQIGPGEVDTSNDGRCESISAFVVELQHLLGGRGNFILVFDGIDRQRDAAPTLLPAISRLGEIIPNLTTVLITTTSNFYLFYHSSIPHIYFAPYTRTEALSILSKDPLPLYTPPSTPQSEDNERQQNFTAEDLAWLWTRFTAAVWDSLGQSVARDVVSFREVCSRLWPPFVQPIKDGLYGIREFSKLMVRNRGLFQSETALRDSIIPIALTAPDAKATKTTHHTLPYYPAYLLISSYLASHNPPRHDITLFSKTSLAKRRKKGGGTALTPRRASSHRKISRKLLGPQPFPLERLFAIFHAILPHQVKGGGANIMCMVATLAGLRLMVKVGVGADVLEGGGKWKSNVSWEFVNDVARGVRFDIESYLVE